MFDNEYFSIVQKYQAILKREKWEKDSVRISTLESN